MEAQIKQIEALLDNRVTFETFRDRGEETLYACVDDLRVGGTRKSPGADKAGAVAKLFQSVMEYRA